MRLYLPFFPRRICLSLFCLSLICQFLLTGAFSAANADLWGLRWRGPADIAVLSARGIEPRYVAPSLSLVEADAEQIADLVADAGLEVVFRDQAGEGESYYLTDHLVTDHLATNHLVTDHSVTEHPVTDQSVMATDGVEVVFDDLSGWALLKVADSRRARLQDRQHFLWPLPQTYSLRGWQSQPTVAKIASPLQDTAVEALLELVDAERLQQHVLALALVDPQGGSGPDNQRSRYARRSETFESTEYIRQQLAAVLGEENVEVQEFRRSADEPLMYNVVATLPGTDPGAGYYVVCAHYDAVGTRTRQGWDGTVDPAPGADDNASGTALVLESARVLAGQRLPWSVRFIAFSGEELGLWGSSHYAETAKQADERVLGVLNFDMIGFNDLSDRLELVTNRASRWIVEQMQGVNDRYNIGLRLDILEDDFARLSDHAPFWARGWDAVLGIENYLPTDSTTVGVKQGLYRLNTQYHSVLDLPDSLNYGLMARVTRLAVGTLAQYGLEEGQANLAVFTGDLTGTQNDDLRLLVSNTGLGTLQEGFRVQVGVCQADSGRCETFFNQRIEAVLAPGAAAQVEVPWQRFGESVFRIEVEVVGDQIESDLDDNRVFQALRLVPQSRIAVFPNPFTPGRARFLHFSGLPLNAVVRVYALSGELVWSGQEDFGGQRNLYTNEVVWSGVNQTGILAGNISGNLAASGIYIYAISDSQGKLLKRDKIAVVR
jgi:hypothetical protein